jgi:hypothetical protein
MERIYFLKKLEISNAQWVAAAILSGNDYADNGVGFGIARNIKYLKTMAKSYSVQELLNDYQGNVDCSGACFNSAYQVFVNGHESLLDPLKAGIYSFISKRNARIRQGVLEHQHALEAQYRD